jgi:indole-3-acetate monooxygenase
MDVRFSEQKSSAIRGTGNETVEDVLARVAALAPTLAGRAAEAEAARRLPADVLRMLRTAGLFRMTAPKIHGGLELDFPDIARVLQAVARIDGSIGWICMVANAAGLLVPRIARETYEEFYRNGPDQLCAGVVTRPAGTAVAEAGGWRVNGRWPFASGCEDADWIGGACVLVKDGQPLPGPVAGIPAIGIACLPARHWQVADTWHACGLRATGSHDVVLHDTVVPSENLVDVATEPCHPGPLYHAPMPFVPLWQGPIALGLAEGALDDATTMAHSGRRQLHAAVATRDSEIFHYELGRAHAAFRAARATFEAQAASHWQHAVAGTLDSEALSMEGTQSAIWVTEACLQVVQRCFALAGAAAVYDSSPLQRRLRDIETAAQHAAVQQRHYAHAGQLLLSATLPDTTRIVEAVV